MKKTTIYFNFIKEKGRSLGEINPGSDEMALSVENALSALNLLDESGIPVLGGDILSENKNGELRYAYQLWGPEYHYLNWSCNKENNESSDQYAERSYGVAKKSIKVANDIATRLNRKCYIVMVV